jgi:hypothetical protein
VCGMFDLFALRILVGSTGISFGKCHFFHIYLLVSGALLFCTVFRVRNATFIWRRGAWEDRDRLRRFVSRWPTYMYVYKEEVKKGEDMTRSSRRRGWWGGGEWRSRRNGRNGSTLWQYCHVNNCIS